MPTLATTGNFPYLIPQVSNITGLTYRAGATEMEVLYALRDYIVNTLQPEFTHALEQIITEFQAGLTGWDERWAAFLANLELELAALNDASVGNLVNTPASATRTALDALYAGAGLTDADLGELIGAPDSDTAAALAALYGDALAAKDGKRYAFIAGVLRNDGAGSGYWQPLTESSTHRPVNIDSVVTDSGKIRINYDSLGANMTVSLLAVPDETLGRAGFTMGASVTPDHADIKMSRVMPPVADYVSFDGTNWVSDTNQFQNIWFSGGKIHLEHKAIASDMTYAVSITPRGGNYLYSVSPDSSPTGSTFVEIGVRDHAGNYVTTPNTNMKFYLTHGAAKVVGLDPTTIDSVTYPLGNIWIFGLMGLPE